MFDSIIKRVQPQILFTRIQYDSISSGSYSVDDIYIWNMQAGKLGSTNGSTYGTVSTIGIEMGRKRWSNLFIGFSSGTWFNQNVTLAMFTVGALGISTIPLNVIDQRSKLLSVTVPSGGTFLRWTIGDALTADGGVVGASTVVADAHYRVSAGLACPMIAITLTAGSAPSSGVLDYIDIGRTT